MNSLQISPQKPTYVVSHNKYIDTEMKLTIAGLKHFIYVFNDRHLKKNVICSFFLAIWPIICAFGLNDLTLLPIYKAEKFYELSSKYFWTRSSDQSQVYVYFVKGTVFST